MALNPSNRSNLEELASKGLKCSIIISYGYCDYFAHVSSYV